MHEKLGKSHGPSSAGEPSLFWCPRWTHEPRIEHGDHDPTSPALGGVRGAPASTFLLGVQAWFLYGQMWSLLHLNFEDGAQIRLLGLIKRKRAGVSQ